MFEIKEATYEQIPEGIFDLLDSDNEGEEFIVAVNEQGDVVGYAQFSGSTLYFIESISQGAGSALMQWFKERFDYILAVDCVEDAWGWYEKMGFESCGAGRSAAHKNMDWYAE